MFKVYVFFFLIVLGYTPFDQPVELEQNSIFNSSALQPFLLKLEYLDSGNQKKVSIVHIGDSHIQADFFSGNTRQHLQNRFGNAGRGFVFPYSLAKTSGSIDVRFLSRDNWSSCSIMKGHERCDIGLAGYNLIGTNQKSFTIDTKSKAQTDARFKTVSVIGNGAVFLPKEMDGSYTVNDHSANSTEIEFQQLQDSITLVAHCDENKAFNLQGVVLENGEKGVLYNSVGVNGSSTNQYLRSTSFEDQMASLETDLVIISYGTNDCYMYSSRFCIDCVKERFETLVERIRERNPKVCILLTTPPDSYIYRKYANQNIPKLQSALKEVCFEQNVALWDFYEVMGGKYSIKKWYAEGLARRDLIHFTKAGYQLQGELLYDALMDAYLNRDDA